MYIKNCYNLLYVESWFERRISGDTSVSALPTRLPVFWSPHQGDGPFHLDLLVQVGSKLPEVTKKHFDKSIGVWLGIELVTTDQQINTLPTA